MRVLSFQQALTALAGAFVLFLAWPVQAQAADMSRLCEVDQVAVLANRIHIKCAPDDAKAFTKDIRYYAMSLSQPPAKIQGVIALATTAKQIRKPLVIWFNWDDYRSVPGCQGIDCRVMSGAALE